MFIARFSLALFFVCTLTQCQMVNRLLQVPLRTLKSVGNMADADQEIQRRAQEVQLKGMPVLEEQKLIVRKEWVAVR